MPTDEPAMGKLRDAPVMRDHQFRSADPDVPGLSVVLGVRETMGSKESACILQVSSKGLVFFVNTNMAGLLGRSRQDIEGQPYEDFDHLPWAPGIITMLYQKVRRQNQALEIIRHYVEPTSGRNQYWRIALFPAESGRVHIVIEDVTPYQKMRETFEKFVSREVIDLMLQTPERDFLRVERRVITVLFGDLRGFTNFSATHEPAQVAAMLGDFLDAMIDVVKAQRGTVDKVVGDEIMALFGAPLESPSHALDACRCAEAMHRSHKLLLSQWTAQGLDPPALGIGLATGEVVVGNIGSLRFMNYTAIGHTVNIAARLCGKAAPGEVLMPLDTAQTVLAQHQARAEDPAPRLQKAGAIEVKGIVQPLNVARLLP